MRRLAFPFVVVAIGLGLFALSGRSTTPRSPNASVGTSVPTRDALPNAKAKLASDALPAKVNLDVPFTSQAPFGVWDEAHNEGCEEASALMVARFWLKQPISGPAEADREILAIEKWETEHLGFWEDTSAADTVKFIEGYWPQLTAEVKPLNSADDLKAEIGRGSPVIVPTNGRLLGNPNYRAPGPRYHMLVVKGYDGRGFITNDSGTRKGAEYRYSGATILRAAHDWQGHDVADGPKVMIVVRPKA
jgi:hypothetical protein